MPCSPLSGRAPAPTSFMPLYCGGLCEAVIMAPPSRPREATPKYSISVGTRPKSTVPAPPAAAPAANASSRLVDDGRGSMPVPSRVAPSCCARAQPMRSAASSSTSCGYSPRTSYALKMSSGIVISPPCRGAELLVELDRIVRERGLRVHTDAAHEAVARADPAAFADHGAVQLRARADAALAHDDAALHLRVRADDDAGLDHRFEDRRPFRDHRAGAEHGQRADPGAGVHAHVLANVAGRYDARPGIDVGRRGDVQVLLAEHVGHRRVDGPLEDVEVGLQIALGRADVAPVTAVDVPVQRPRLGQPREHATLDLSLIHISEPTRLGM